MSTATTQQTKSPQSRRTQGNRETAAEGGSDQVVVLIRLPLVSQAEIASESRTKQLAAGAALASGKSSRETQATIAEPIAPGPVEDVYTPHALPSLSAAEGQPLSSTGAVTEAAGNVPASPTGDDRIFRRAFDPDRFRGRVQVPIAVWQSLGAAAAFLLIIMAIIAIRGDSGGQVAREDDRGGASHSSQPLTDVPSHPAFSVAVLDPPDLGIAPRLPELPPHPKAVAAAGKSESDQAKPKQPEATAPEVVKPGGGEAEPSGPEAKDPAAEPLSPAPDADPAAASPGKGDDNSDSPPLTGSADAASGDAARAPAPPAAVAQPPVSAAGQVAANAQPLPNGMSQPSLQAVQQDYPRTDPATFQYPSHYEELLRAAGGGSDVAAGMSTQDRGSMYRWQPNTARLQPGIEAPPIR